MLATKSPGFATSPPRLLGTPTGELKFRVQGGEHDGRIVRISSSKCTIGSAAGCTFRLRARGVDPLHCLILCGRNGTLIRRNSPRTYLNGGPFEDAPLVPGDVLRFASIELLVVSCPVRAEGAAAVSPKPMVQEAQVSTTIVMEPATARAKQDAQEQIARLEREQQTARNEQTRLARELAESQESLRQAHERLEEALRAKEQASPEDARSDEPLRKQYSQLLAQQQQERAEQQEREDRLRAEVDRFRESTQELQTYLAAREGILGQELATARSVTADIQQQLAAQKQQPKKELEEVRRNSSPGTTSEPAAEPWEEKLAAAKALHDAEQAAWLWERKELEAKAEYSAKIADRCRALEAELAQVRNQLELAVVQEHEAQQQRSNQYEEQLQRWQAEAHQRQLQAEELGGQLEQVKGLCTRLESECAELKAGGKVVAGAPPGGQDLNYLYEQLERQQSELTQARAELQHERDQVARLLAETSSREDALAHFEAELRQREHDWNASRTEQAAALDERAQVIATQIAQFEAEQAAFARQQATIIQQMSALEDRVQELTGAGSGDARQTNSPFVIPRLADPAQLEQLELAEKPYIRPANEDAEPTTCPPPPVAVTQVITKEPTAGAHPQDSSLAGEPSEGEVDSVMSRLRQAGMCRQEDGEGPAAEAAPQETPPPQKAKYKPPSFLEQAAEMARQEELGMAHGSEPVAVAPPPEAPRQAAIPAPVKAAHEDDDSIESYMARLLNRMRGSGDAAAASHATQEGPPTEAPSAEAADPSVSSVPETPASQEYVRRTQTPEHPERLSQMRELANTAAQSAIHAHGQKRAKVETKRKSFVALLSFIGAVGLAAAYWSTGSTLAVAGSLAFFGACCFMTLRALQNALRHMRLNRPKVVPAAPPVQVAAPTDTPVPQRPAAEPKA